MSDVNPRFKGKKKPKTPTKTRQLKQADTLFSQIVRSAGRCANCSSTEHLQCAHGFSRRYRAVRFDERNAWPLCRSCHVYFTHRPLEWDDWMVSRLGDHRYVELRHEALTGPNPDLGETLKALRERYTALGLGESA